MKSIFKKIISSIIQFEAKLILNKYKPKIIAVTGSVGKTSTKDAIFSVMSPSFYIRKSEKSFNSDIGIPLTILGCQNAWSDPFLWFKNIFIGLDLILFKEQYPKWLVLEVGADRPGDIKQITKWLKPDVVVITAFAKVPVHIEFFSSRDQVVREKKYLVEALKHDGVIIVNGDDMDATKMRDSIKNNSITYGTDGVSDIVASNSTIHYSEDGKIDGMSFKVDYKENSVPIIMKGSLGAQNIYSALAAIAVGLSQKINLVKMGEALLNHETPKGRMKIISGIKNTTIIDDTYNSSPIALVSALLTLKNIKTRGKKIAVLGDMMELGKHSTEEHYEAGKVASDSCDILVTVGMRSIKMAEGALDGGLSEKNIFQYEDSVSAGKFVQEILSSNDIILMKASQSIRMEKAVEEIMAEPEKVRELLVRQDDEWLDR
ncbi:MAG: Mur ligase family protein [Candidatus Paceibacterota bacterium]|jgi:UDP-N-acetylmuramoyl-tripeptide--D-alanyl-D-alanine ligase